MKPLEPIELPDDFQVHTMSGFVEWKDNQGGCILCDGEQQWEVVKTEVPD